MIAAPTESSSPHQRLGLGLLLFLCAAELPLAFRAGGYFPRLWMPVALVVAAVALVMVVSGPAPRLTRVQGALLGVFLFLAVWTSASLLWAGSRGNAWEEADRTLLYLMGAGLVTVAVGWAGPRGLRGLTLGVLGAIGVTAVVVVARLTLGGDILQAFTGDRLHYPVTYWNGLAALLMMGFWLALCLSSARTQPWWRRALLVSVAVMLVGLAVLPQSRGALWTFFIVVPWFVVLTPHRFRGLVHLGVVVGLTVIAWPALTGVWALRNGPAAQTSASAVGEVAFRGAVHHALLSMLACGVAAFVASTVVSAVEARISPLERRWVRGIGVALVVIGLLGAGLGLFALQRTHGDLTAFAHRAWNQFTADQGPAGGSSSRFNELGLNGRLGTWRIAVRAFSERPLLGLGAQNFEFYYTQHRTTGLWRWAHSRPMELLSDLGLPGAAAYGIFIVGTLLVGIRMRVRARRPENQAALAAALLAVGSWVVHSSADWLWQLGGVTWPAVLLMGGLLAAGADGRRDDGAATARSDSADSDGLRSDGARPAIMMHPNVVRVTMVAVALVLLASASINYLSLRYLAIAGSGGSLVSTIAAAEAAARLNPFSPQPSLLIADAYARSAHSAALAGDSEGTMTNLTLAAGAREEATRQEPLAWALHLSAGLAILEYRDAAVAAGFLESRPAKPQPPSVGTPPSAGAAELPGAPRGTRTTTPTTFRQATWEELNDWARAHLTEAQRLNPLDPQLPHALARLNE